MFTGQFEDDKEHGFGRNNWPDGSWYEGDYKEGQQHGKGSFVIMCDDIKLFEYEGEWFEGK